MASTNGNFGSDRLFPWLCGIGVSAGAYLALFPGSSLSVFRISGFSLAVFPFLLALPLATLRVRGKRLLWLGPKHTVAAASAGVLGILFPVLIEVSFWRTAEFSLALLGAFIALVGVLSGWFAFGLQRWAQADRVPMPPARLRWDPRTWGASGLVGATILSLALTLLVVLAASSSPPYGPTAYEALYAEVLAAVLLLVGLVGVVSEVAASWIYRRRTA